ncbi:MAG: hypothetical protein GY715_12950, partial [Planctomycetes bacterium]|nr:hypothetical protein [Planctomycetota bacterium]
FYRSSLAGMKKVEITEQCTNPSAERGDPSNLKTVRVYYPSGTEHISSGRIHMAGYPDGRADIYEYEKCSYSPVDGGPGEYVPDSSGEEVCNIVTHRYGKIGGDTGVETLSDEVTGKTTQDVTVSSILGIMLLDETLVYNGSEYEPVRWTVYENDDMGRPVKTVRSDGTVTETEWDCCRKLWEKDARGIVTGYNYDGLGRLESVTDENNGITAAYTYDAEGRQLTETVSSGTLSIKTADNTYDGAGRLKITVNQAGLETKYNYLQNGLETTVIRPGGAEETTLRYLSGNIRSVSGSGVIPRNYEYGAYTDDSMAGEYALVNTGSDMWEKTYTDMAGRTVTSEKPGYEGTSLIKTKNRYDSAGRLIKSYTTPEEQSPTLYEYDPETGELLRSALDTDGDGELNLSSDRISES